MITLNHRKVKNPDGKQHNFISYFQSVTTIGVVIRAKTSQEAETQASEKLKKSELTCGLVGQTPFMLSATEEWTPDLSNIAIKPNSIALDLGDSEKLFISEMLHKNPEELSHHECSEYIKRLLGQEIRNCTGGNIN